MSQSDAEESPSALFQEFVNTQYSGIRKEFWRNLTSFVQGRCEAELREREIQATVTSRVKAANSLLKTLPRLNQRQIRNRKKFEDEQQEGQHAPGDPNPYPGAYQNHTDILDDTLDIAGIRISIYFPNQLPEVREMLEDKRWIKRSTQKTFTERGHIPMDQEMRPYEERFGYYPAVHFSIRLAPEAIDHEQVLEYADEPIEVQVRTVLIDAWAEVRHDLVYKVLGGHGHLSSDELRILDSLKGLTATGELLLEHLHGAHRKRLERDSRVFPDDRENFMNVLVETLAVRHQPLLDLVGSNLGDCMELLHLLQHLDISTPKMLKEELVDLNTKQQIIHEVERVKYALGAASLSSFLVCYLSQTYFERLFMGSFAYDSYDARDMKGHKARCSLQIICFTLSLLDERLEKSPELNESEAMNWCLLFHLHEWIASMIEESARIRQAEFWNRRVHENICEGASLDLVPDMLLQTMLKLAPQDSDAVMMPIYMSLAKVIAETSSKFDLEQESVRSWSEDSLVRGSHNHGRHDLFKRSEKVWDNARLEIAEITGHTSLDLTIAVARRATLRSEVNLVEHCLDSDELQAHFSGAGELRRTDLKIQYNVAWILVQSAVVGSDVRMLKLLLQKWNIDPNCSDISGRTPLHLAVLMENNALIATLLQDRRINLYARECTGKGTKWWPANFTRSLSMSSTDKRTALDYAIHIKNADIARVLLQEMGNRESLMRQWRPLIKHLEASGFDEGLKCNCLPLRTLRALGLVFLQLGRQLNSHLERVLKEEGIV
ncbi:hypothetical protein CC80DRAFT_489544 [Byssothecium circinans]|uniref:RelA/SpoT domain-containing protein n=1 Tax=Byssothecium circinans TaxID=147558 RepID=A0A6A5U6R6_9PLEO|nr:hypothetical protein CC80DRAFT_489544 [Byssothecium circinans]